MTVGYLQSPIGYIRVVVADNKVSKIEYVNDEQMTFIPDMAIWLEEENQVLKQAIQELQEYLAGSRATFTLKIEFEGTPFQKSVWNALMTIPYGETCSYGDIANRIGNPKAVRAVGQANRVNPLPIIIPCHRVIGKNRSMTGYAGSQIEKKEFLLHLEGFQP
jgi:methylated-DNA-[protein]-cysteine S-methyltransferase